MNDKRLISKLRSIPDFPKKGILFYDISTLLKDNECLKIISDELYELYKDKGITKVVGVESRGFIVSAILAYKLGAGMVLCRKPGKLPAETLKENYSKEYGKDIIEIHKDAITPDDVVLIHDDLLATGGTIKAACKLVSKFSPKKIYTCFIIELVNEGLHGREAIGDKYEIETLIQI